MDVNGWIWLQMAGMAGNGCKQLYMAGMAGNDRKWLPNAEYGLKLLKMAEIVGNRWKWLKLAERGWRFARNGIQWLKQQEMAGNGSTFLGWLRTDPS